jgi:hypothetical protein
MMEQQRSPKRFNSSPNLTFFVLETLLARADVGGDA